MELVKSLQECNWRQFEQLISEVLELHNFESCWNVNVTINGLRRQFDVIANKNDYSLIIDCKKWDNKKSRVGALKKAVVLHKERCKFYANLIQKREIPLIITYAEDDIRIHEDVYIVPLHKLNDFILGLP